VVVGRFDAVCFDERPERGPEFEQVAGDRFGVTVACVFGRVGLQDRLEFAFERGDAAFERSAVAVAFEGVPGVEEVFGDAKSGLAEFLAGTRPFGVRSEVANQV
jgi:hypothetical protein